VAPDAEGGGALNSAQLLNKSAQLMVVVAGFFTGLALLPWNAGEGLESTLRQAATVLFMLGLALRYWWVILLLDWPWRVIRSVLLLAVWAGVVAVAAHSRDSREWTLALMAVAWTGALTEAYNLATRQWRRDKAALTATLFRDHVVGMAAAAAGGAALLGIAFLVELRWQPVLVFVFVLLDWARLVEMIRRHQRLFDE
jgi:hypothetical protein